MNYPPPIDAFCVRKLDVYLDMNVIYSNFVRNMTHCIVDMILY